MSRTLLLALLGLAGCEETRATQADAPLTYRQLENVTVDTISFRSGRQCFVVSAHVYGGTAVAIACE